jgi:hypothetical protein
MAMLGGNLTLGDPTVYAFLQSPLILLMGKRKTGGANKTCFQRALFS